MFQPEYDHSSYMFKQLQVPQLNSNREINFKPANNSNTRKLSEINNFINKHTRLVSLSIDSKKHTHLHEPRIHVCDIEPSNFNSVRSSRNIA
jgi:hypothetical protein